MALRYYLADCGVEVWVEARVVWAKDSKLWLERPAVRIWQLNDLGYLLKDITAQRSLAEDTVHETMNALEGVQAGRAA